MKKIFFILPCAFIANFMAAQGITKNGNIVTDASFNTIKVGNVLSNGKISSPVGSFGKLILNTVSVHWNLLNNYNVSNVGVLIVTGDGNDSFNIFGFSGGTPGQVIYLIDDRIRMYPDLLQSFVCMDYTSAFGSADQRFLINLNGDEDSKLISPNAVVTLVYDGNYWRILSGGSNLIP